MRALVQRVSEARVTVGERVSGEINAGALILICAVEGDGEAEAELLAGKIAKLRIFRDQDDRMNRSILDAGGSALVVSQFTLAADLSRGNRPGFSRAAAPELGRELYQRFCALLGEQGITVETGEFGADMAVSLINDGPVTIWMDSQDWAKRP
ncbi:MAG: D-tyrosyl-tRNA(Tyr) deacylase [Rhodospirillaceae bacterium]|jgi:D-tyrosyl-tRNA(Tyr) deacylase|nr:D-tyrosyl-tRNA(Tyr) deacylase [Rhodospirillaceae bacterium]MBT3927917.1 D-tyrosyl-tRNA(Tyr) deacylase [Rhodospirillaceae bacterium]MBT4426717.1 D-tyrosyl-tRNA(Tyr) deacylase [Rhodospirillaceae bacterium]MBT5040425.1 D-tyrosyl-tRNA(Tyr) deacylase [Rhodospirillaceae bacterium]MBT5674742.1 D-tyrosyl-tRNA(Tyr) deacylase [Rhodospirillaceae bacterium]